MPACLDGRQATLFWLGVFMQVQDIEDTPPCSRFFFFLRLLFEGLFRTAYRCSTRREPPIYVAFGGTTQKRYFLELLKAELQSKWQSWDQRRDGEEYWINSVQFCRSRMSDITVRFGGQQPCHTLNQRQKHVFSRSDDATTASVDN